MNIFNWLKFYLLSPSLFMFEWQCSEAFKQKLFKLFKEKGN